MTIKRRKFTVILEPEDDGGYSVHCPALHGCVSQGDDRRSAIENIKEAIGLVLDASDGGLPETPAQGRAETSYHDTPDLVAEEIRHILEGRDEDGLPYAGVSIEQVEITFKAHE